MGATIGYFSDISLMRRFQVKTIKTALFKTHKVGDLNKLEHLSFKQILWVGPTI